MSPHDRDLYRQQMGHVRLGLTREQLESWCSQCGLKVERFWQLPPDSAATGPALFSAVAHRVEKSQRI
jgi:hypothetical protein